MNLRHINRNEFKGGLNSKPEPNCWICAGGRLKERTIARRVVQQDYSELTFANGERLGQEVA